MPRPRVKVWISCGELSGDQRGAELVRELRKLADLQAFGIPGRALRDLGVEPLRPMEDLRGLGIVEVLRGIPDMLALIRDAARCCRERRPDVAILVDYGEFHMRLGARLRHLGIPVFHLAPPKLWAWGTFRVRRLHASANALGVLFPFEVGFYQKHGFRVVHVGHPVAKLLDVPVPKHRRRLWLLPGSRPSEIARHLHLMVQVARRVAPALHLRPTLGVAPGLDTVAMAHGAEGIEVLALRDPAVLADGALALAASGTVNLELAALGVPQVVTYVTHSATYAIGRPLVRTRWLNPLNICAERDVVREVRQWQATPARLERELLDTWERRREIERSGREIVATLRRDEGLMEAAHLCLTMGQDHP